MSDEGSLRPLDDQAKRQAKRSTMTSRRGYASTPARRAIAVRSLLTLPCPRRMVSAAWPTAVVDIRPVAYLAIAAEDGVRRSHRGLRTQAPFSVTKECRHEMSAPPV